METTKQQARKAWLKAKSGESLSDEEKNACFIAYTFSELPKDDEYSVAQWVEDGCKAF